MMEAMREHLPEAAQHEFHDQGFPAGLSVAYADYKGMLETFEVCCDGSMLPQRLLGRCTPFSHSVDVSG